MVAPLAGGPRASLRPTAQGGGAIEQRAKSFGKIVRLRAGGRVCTYTGAGGKHHATDCRMLNRGVSSHY